MPMPLSGANLWSKQKCMIAVDVPRGRGSPILWTWLHSNNLISGKGAWDHFSEPLVFYDYKQYSRHWETPLPAFVKVVISLTPDAWTESMLDSNGIVDKETIFTFHKNV